MVNIIQIKIMPVSPSVNLDRIKTEAEKRVIKSKGKLHSSETQAVAFGLKALILTIMWPDDKGTDELENLLSNIKDVNSVQVIDMRRAVG